MITFVKELDCQGVFSSIFSVFTFSDIMSISRWAVIGWLLTTCTNQMAASNAKLALFYDWLFFDAEKDNIMNIEPAILVMHHSMR